MSAELKVLRRDLATAMAASAAPVAATAPAATGAKAGDA